MSSFLSELKYSGRANTRVALSTADAKRFLAAIEGLPVAAKAGDACWSWRNCDTKSPEWLLSVSEGDTRDSAILKESQVISTRLGTRDDPEKKLRSMIAAVVVAASTTPVATAGVAHALKKPTKKKSAVTSNPYRCNHKPGFHKGSFAACGCGEPADAKRWRLMDICEASNCFNFAVRDVWCSMVPNGAGATPVSTPTDFTSKSEWAAILCEDHILEAPSPSDPPAGHSGGWNIALMVHDRDFHFLRLDDGYWTHKFSQLPPQTCDVRGAKMPAEDLELASLCDYKLVGYFYVPTALKINH